MKKILILAATLVIFASCGNPTSSGDKDETDTTGTQDSTVTALGATYDFGTMKLRNTKNSDNLVTTDGKIYFDPARTIEIGTISTDHEITFTLPDIGDAFPAGASNQFLDPADENLTKTPSHGIRLYESREFYTFLPVHNTSSYRIKMYSTTRTSTNVIFIYATDDTVLKGLKQDGLKNLHYDCDLKKGWNWIEEQSESASSTEFYIKAARSPENECVLYFDY